MASAIARTQIGLRGVFAAALVVVGSVRERELCTKQNSRGTSVKQVHLRNLDHVARRIAMVPTLMIVSGKSGLRGLLAQRLAALADTPDSGKLSEMSNLMANHALAYSKSMASVTSWIAQTSLWIAGYGHGRNGTIALRLAPGTRKGSERSSFTR